MPVYQHDPRPCTALCLLIAAAAVAALQSWPVTPRRRLPLRRVMRHPRLLRRAPGGRRARTAPRRAPRPRTRSWRPSSHGRRLLRRPPPMWSAGWSSCAPSTRASRSSASVLHIPSAALHPALPPSLRTSLSQHACFAVEEREGAHPTAAPVLAGRREAQRGSCVRTARAGTPSDIPPAARSVPASR